MKRIALIGSSGGNLHRLGGSDPAQLIRSIQDQLVKAGAELVAVCFVSADASLDAVTERSTGSLWRIEHGVPAPVATGLLAEINDFALSEDIHISELIDAGRVDGIIMISADPAGTNKRTVRSVAAHGLPAAGSGGSSIAAAESLGIRFVSASGTTGTTNHTRAISYVSGFAREWGLDYRPNEFPKSWGAFARQYDPRPILVDSLPAVLAIAAVIGVCRHLPFEQAQVIATAVLPLILVAVAFTAAARVSNVGQAGMLSGIIAGALAANSGLLGALVAGFLAGTISDLLVTAALKHNWPATTANILGSGLAGLIAGVPVRFALAVPGSAIDSGVAFGVRFALDHGGILVGAVIGALMWPVLLRGLYHSVVLPLMVLEFSAGGLSFLAAIDMVALVAVSAGFALSAIAFGGVAERRGARLTLRINMLFGTYVEGTFPTVKRHWTFLAAAIGAGAVSGAIVGLTGSYGVTYLPIPLLPVVGSEPLGLVGALVIALVLAFLFASVIRLVLRPSRSPR